jgi:hypothetical protein
VSARILALKMRPIIAPFSSRWLRRCPTGDPTGARRFETRRAIQCVSHTTKEHFYLGPVGAAGERPKGGAYERVDLLIGLIVVILAILSFFGLR